MFLGLKMTPAAAQRLKVEGWPQERAVCVPAGLWDDYVLGETQIERTCYAMQQLQDLNDYSSSGRGDTRLADIASMTMKWGLVEEFRDRAGRKIQDLEPIVAWINKRFINQKPPQIAVRDDGMLLRVNLGDVSCRPFKFVSAGPGLLDKAECESDLDYRMNEKINPHPPWVFSEYKADHARATAVAEKAEQEAQYALSRVWEAMSDAHRSNWDDITPTHYERDAAWRLLEKAKVARAAVLALQVNAN